MEDASFGEMHNLDRIGAIRRLGRALDWAIKLQVDISSGFAKHRTRAGETPLMGFLLSI